MSSTGNGTNGIEDDFFDPVQENESTRLIRQAIDIIGSAKALPLSSSVRVEPDELLPILEDAVALLPEELRQARWLLKERDDFLQKVQREGDAILDEAQSRAAKLVSRQEIVKEAKRTAQQTIDEADAEARKKKHEAEDWTDQQLAKLEMVLDRISKTAQAGREKLRPKLQPVDSDLGGLGAMGELGNLDLAEDATSATFFDQEG
jgi:dsDNA-specific endonuclease/ATPase MutS2